MLAEVMNYGNNRIQHRNVLLR